MFDSIRESNVLQWTKWNTNSAISPADTNDDDEDDRGQHSTIIDINKKPSIV